MTRSPDNLVPVSGLLPARVHAALQVHAESKGIALFDLLVEEALARFGAKVPRGGVAELVLDGYLDKEIAPRLKMSLQTVREHRRRAGLPANRPNSLEDVRRLTREGKSVAAICRALHLAPRTVTEYQARILRAGREGTT